MRYTLKMKTATLPPIRVRPELRAEIETVLAEGESLSQFVETAVQASLERRRIQSEFIARGLRARDEAKLTGDYVDAAELIAGLERKLEAARALMSERSKASA